MLILVTSIINAALIFIIGLVVLRQRPHGRINQLFFTSVAFISLWIITLYLSDQNFATNVSLFWNRMVFVVAIGWTIPLYLFTLDFPNPDGKYRFWRAYVWAGIVFFFGALTPLIVSGVQAYNSGVNINTGLLYPVYLIWVAGLFISFLVIVVLKYRHLVGIERARFQYLFIGLVIFASSVFLFNVVIPTLTGATSLARLGSLSEVFFTALTAYAIIAHRLFDIRVIIKRTVVYSVLLIFILSTYAIIVFFFSQVFGGQGQLGLKSFVPSMIAAILIAFGFEPLRRWLQNATDKYLFKGEYDTQDIIRSLAKVMTNVVNLDEALDSMMSVVTGEMRISRVATLVVRKIEKDMVVQRVKSTGYSNAIKLEDQPTGTLLEYFIHHPEMVVLDELKQKNASLRHPSPKILHIIAQLEHFQASVALPLLVNKQIIGILMIGEKLSGDSFSRDDLEALELIGSQTASSIEKAKFYEEDKLKSEFISIASHELLSPTAAIEGYLSMVLDEKMKITKDQQNQYVKRAYDSSRRLADLVKDLLSISRIESGKIKIAPVAMDVVAIVEQAIDELKVMAKEKNLVLTFTPPSGKIPKVIADPDRIMQVCINLINNAIKYTPKGTVTVNVENRQATVLVSVTDSGIGISKEDQEHLFEKFHRIDNPATAGIMGTGLGLYIVKNIITLLHGEMKVKSEAEKGSTFSFSLPVAK